MTPLQRLSIVIICFAALVANIWALNVRLESAHAARDLAQSNEHSALKNNADLNTTVNTLSDRLIELHAAGQRLATTKTELTAALRRSELNREKLRRENETYRLWADQPLPDAVVRLRERPTLTGAQSYLDWMSGRDAMPASGDIATTEQPAQQ